MTGRSRLPLRSREVPCTVTIQDSAEGLHAHVELAGVDVGPGDSVRVLDAPHRARPAIQRVYRRRATVVRAGPVGRLWTRLTAFLELETLYEVGFSDRRTP